MILHFGGASTAAVVVTVTAIFFLIFAMSFAVGAVPEGHRRFSSNWLRAWFRASLPRLIVAGAFSFLIFIGSSLSGNGNATEAQTCNSPLAPLTGQTITDPRIVSAISGMREIAGAAREGNAAAAQSLFFTTDAHNLTHDIAGPLFLTDRDLARTLCASVIGLENEIAGGLRPDVIAEHAEAAAEALQAARDALNPGIAPTPIAGASDPCALPIGAIGAVPLTGDRLIAAAGALREAASRARNNDVTGASEAFAGDAHSITHDIDGPLRSADPGLAVALCESVVKIEHQFATTRDTAVIAAEAETSAGLLEEAGRALGIIE